MPEELYINYFPGHHTKALRQIQKALSQIDAVCEIVDARIPYSSRNPEIDSLISEKPRLIIMNRVDQADPAVTARWTAFYKNAGVHVLETDCKSGKGTAGFPQAVRLLLKEKLDGYAAKGQVGRVLRVMIVGVPNVGKSSFINRVAKRKAAIASDRPGVTRGKQWITIDKNLELLDTPGILWPKFEDQTMGENLAFTGAVKDEILDRVTLSANLMSRLAEKYPDGIKNRFKIEISDEDTGFDMLEKAAQKRGFLVSKGEYDLERMAAVLLDEFRGGKLGRISLEEPKVMENEK